MNILALVHAGLEKLAQQEVLELLQLSSKPHQKAVEFSCNASQLRFFLLHAQSVRRVLLSLAKVQTLENFSFSDVPWTEICPANPTVMVDLEHVQGAELRKKGMDRVRKELVKVMHKHGLVPTFQLKNSNLTLLIHFTGYEYIMGIDLAGELHKRSYRVFPHQASFTGDIAYAIIRFSQFSTSSKLLVGLVKDGTIAIEAALFANKLPTNNHFSSFLPLLQIPLPPVSVPTTIIFAFDESIPNLTAARKNMYFAGVKELVDVQKYALDELDVKFSPGDFTHLIFQVTTKDEVKLNEIYYQSSYLLGESGFLLLITRKNLELSISDRFHLVDKRDMQRGQSWHSWWLLKKN